MDVYIALHHLELFLDGRLSKRGENKPLSRAWPIEFRFDYQSNAFRGIVVGRCFYDGRWNGVGLRMA